MFWSFFTFFFYKISQTSQKLFEKIVKIRALNHSSLSSLVEIKKVFAYSAEDYL